MKITPKLILVVLILAIVVLTIDTYLHVQREMEIFRDDVERDTRTLARVLRPVLTTEWEVAGQAGVWRFVRSASVEREWRHFRWRQLADLAHASSHLAPPQLASLTQGELVFVTIPDSQAPRTIYAYVPIVAQAHVVGVLEMQEDLTFLRRYVRQTTFGSSALGLILPRLILPGLIVSAILLMGIHWINRPLLLVMEKARRIGAGDLDGPLRFRSHDELAEVATVMNELCEELKGTRRSLLDEMSAHLQTLEQLRHADRLNTVGTMASAVAHELGTPLNVVSARAELIASGRLSPLQVRDSAQVIKQQVQEMTTDIQRMLDFSRHTPSARIPTDLRSLTQQTIDLIAPLATRQHAVITRQMGDDPITVRVDATQFQHVLVNMMKNAWQAMPQGGEVALEVRRVHVQAPSPFKLSEGRYAAVMVTDQGVGVDADLLPRIFDPFVTTRKKGEGTGLGLAIASNIIRGHGGWIDVISHVGEGSCFTVYLPLEEA